MMVPREAQHLYIFAFTCVGFILFYFYGILHFYRDPGSIFFDPSRAVEQHYSLIREKEAFAFRDAIYFAIRNRNAVIKQLFWNVGHSPTICGVFITVKRDTGKSKNPLELAISSSLSGLVKSERQDIDLRVYFADTDPTIHPLRMTWLMELVDNSTSAKELISKEAFQSLQDMEERKQILGAKVMLDYAYALKYAYDTSSAPYIAIFEDDVVFADGWLSRTILGLQKIEKKVKASGKDWVDLRLFNNESNIGFASHAIFGNNVPIIIVLTSSTVFGILRLFQLKTNTGRRFITIQLCFIVCVFTIPLFIIAFFQAGKSSILPPSPGVALQPWGLCSQGVVVPRHQVPHLVEEFRKRNFDQPDIAMKAFANTNGLQRFVLNPVQVQHLGYKSSIDIDRKGEIWSMAFESLSSKRLEKDHRRMVTKLYGQAPSTISAHSQFEAGSEQSTLGSTVLQN